MTTRVTLELFETPPADAEEVTLTPEALEELRLTAFDKGYAAGWEDGQAARDQEETAIGEAFLAHLQALSFTYHEARSQILQSLQPLLGTMTGTVLPKLAQRSFAPILAEKLQVLAEEMARPSVTLRCAPSQSTALQSLLAQEKSLPVTLQEDPELTPGQALLLFEAGELSVDLDAVVAAIEQLVADFFAVETDPERMQSYHDRSN